MTAHYTGDQTVAPPQEAARILVIDDDPALGQAIRMSVQAGGYRVAWAANGKQGLAQVAQWHPDVVILDLGLPDLDGIVICDQIRVVSDVPIIILSVRDRDQDKITALEHGADDYLTKPFSAGELLARIRVALRHAAQRAGGQGTGAQAQIGDLVINFARRVVQVRGQEVHLSPTEYALLTYLAQHLGKVITHQTLLQAVWGPQFTDALPYLRVAVTHIRRKIEQDSAHPQFLLNEPGIGYRLQRPEELADDGMRAGP